MTGRDIFKIWAPTGAKWADWVRPVPFTAIHDSREINYITDFTIPDIYYLTEIQENMALIVDLPGYESIKESISLAGLGMRPIPLYNGTNEQEGAMALVENHSIESALIWGAKELEKIDILLDAPPAFLLDSNRTHSYKMNISIFDNSWDLYAHDMPSSEYFLDHGINMLAVRSEMIRKDLAGILYEFQKEGITILFTNGFVPPKKIILKKPPRLK